MQIIHILDTFFPELVAKGKDDLVHPLQVYNSYGPYKPKVIVDDKLVIIELDKEKIIAQAGEYRKVLALTVQGLMSEKKGDIRAAFDRGW